MQNVHRDDGILIVEVPHQGAPTAYSLLDRAAFEDSLRDKAANDGGRFTQWLHDNFAATEEIIDGVSAIEALENDIENVIEFWNHDLHSSHVFDDRDEAAAMLGRLDEGAGRQLHGQLAIAGALRAWLEPSLESLEELRAEMQTQPDSVFLSEDCEDWPTFGGDRPAEAAIVSVWSWDEERALIGEGDNLTIITREQLRADFGSN